MVGRIRAPPMGRPYQVPGCTGAPRLPLGARARPTSRTLGSCAFPSPRSSASSCSSRSWGRAARRPRRRRSTRAGPCVDDGSAPGAYPDLEALVPATFEGKGPDRLDSGRNCTAENLANLQTAGIDELRFAGGTWGFGAERAAALVVFTAKGLTADLLADFYATSAQGADRTNVTGITTPSIAGRPGHRLDTKTGERLQTVLVWPAATPTR